MLPPPAASDVADVGIHALEVYTPRHCVRAADLEVAHGCAGKYTHGLRMRESSTCDEDEDVASMAMSAVRRLLDKRGVRRRDVGMLMVGSESLIDRSKSLKSRVMAVLADEEARADERLFLAADDADADADAAADEEEDDACADVEGVDTYHACYGGTAALLACSNWAESRAWDGRWAIAVCTDVSDAPAQYAFMNGAAAVAVLVGPRAPLVMQTPRVSCVLDEWDFYKPVGWPSMGPIIDGPHSKQVYYDCLVRLPAAHARQGGVHVLPRTMRRSSSTWAAAPPLCGTPLRRRRTPRAPAPRAPRATPTSTSTALSSSSPLSTTTPSCATASSGACSRPSRRRSASGRCTPRPRTSTCARCCCTRLPRAASTSASSRLGRAPRPRCSGCGSTATAAGRWPTRG